METTKNTNEKSKFSKTHDQLIYWSSIGWDVISPRKNKGIYVLGYTKSGTNWLCNLISGVLEIPILEAWNLVLPKFSPCIYHMHRFIPLDSVRRRTIYIMRDGRDTMVSRYFHIVRNGGAEKEQLDIHLGHPATAENIESNMAEFIRFMQTSNLASTDYQSHIELWKKHKHQYTLIHYEDLLAEPARELTRVITDLSGAAPDPDRIDTIVEQHNFSRLTKRKRGEEDTNSFIRKGISGDWKNYFTAEAASVFDEYAGNLLLDLGYENDPDWASKLKFHS